jgi:hypothetical protein
MSSVKSDPGQMVRTLERRGFIEHSHDWHGKTVPRSIRVVWEG